MIPRFDLRVWMTFALAALFCAVLVWLIPALADFTGTTSPVGVAWGGWLVLATLGTGVASVILAALLVVDAEDQRGRDIADAPAHGPIDMRPAIIAGDGLPASGEPAGGGLGHIPQVLPDPQGARGWYISQKSRVLKN